LTDDLHGADEFSILGTWMIEDFHITDAVVEDDFFTMAVDS